MLKFSFLINFSPLVRQNKRPSTPKFVSLSLWPLVYQWFGLLLNLAICLTEWPERMVTNSVGLQRPQNAFSQRLRKYTFTAVHTKTHKRRFQIYPLWRAFTNLCVYGERFHRLRVDGRPKRTKKFAFTSVCVYNRLRVDGALYSRSSDYARRQFFTS